MIFRTACGEGGGWATEDTPYKGHGASVEDIQWSPTEAAVFASCSVDQTVRIWDARKKSDSALKVKAADCDVNVIAWNRRVPYLLASGDDQGNLRVWDLRSIKGGEAVGDLGWHTEAITSVEWSPDQPSVICASSADNQVTVWDMSVERDAEAEAQMAAEGIEIPDLPPQLIFIHQGQKDVKEVHWHPQCPGLLGSTAATGFNLFKTINS
jgi:ribosome assembly protein RRB1